MNPIHNTTGVQSQIYAIILLGTFFPCLPAGRLIRRAVIAAVGVSVTFLFLIVVLVEAGAFENYTTPRPYQTVDLTSALGALLYRLVLHALEQVEIFLTLIAFVFVCRHLSEHPLHLIYERL